MRVCVCVNVEGWRTGEKKRDNSKTWRLAGLSVCRRIPTSPCAVAVCVCVVCVRVCGGILAMQLFGLELCGTLQSNLMMRWNLLIQEVCSEEEPHLLIKQLLQNEEF